LSDSALNNKLEKTVPGVSCSKVYASGFQFTTLASGDKPRLMLKIIHPEDGNLNIC
jgi:hypothetical protein